MPFPSALARFNRRVTNPVARHLAGHGVRHIAMVEHRGRTTGRVYRTPVLVHPEGDDRYLVALTYGPDAEWVRNVLAAGAAVVEVRERAVRCSSPRIVRFDRPPPAVRGIARAGLRLLRVRDYLELTRV